jgi:fructose-1,6-bisphosphatase I
MRQPLTLETYLAGWGATHPQRRAAAGVLVAIASACAEIASMIARGPLAGDLAASAGENAGGDEQKALDVWANDRLVEALAPTGVAAIASEELAAPLLLRANGEVAVALDPLDGSSNIDTNVSIGTIFSVVRAAGEKTFLQAGSLQIASGYVIYGPQCALVLTVGKGTLIFTLDPETRRFRLPSTPVTIKSSSNEYAINASNYRHWSEALRCYIDDCIAGAEGPRGADVNMRWIASLVAECHRILTRGGVFLYPSDRRNGYEHGRLRLVYEANPIAFLVEQAGGKAFDGQTRILDIVPSGIHQRTPLIFGSVDEVDRIARYKADPSAMFERSPLFGRRGLLRA